MTESDRITDLLGPGPIPLATIKQWHQSKWLDDVGGKCHGLFSFCSRRVQQVCNEFGHPDTPLQRDNPEEARRIKELGIDEMRDVEAELRYTTTELSRLARSPNITGTRLGRPINLEHKQRNWDERFFVKGEKASTHESPVDLDAEYELNPKRLLGLLQRFNEMVVKYQPISAQWKDETRTESVDKPVQQIEIPTALIELARDCDRNKTAGQSPA
jgi:hypothetical protein